MKITQYPINHISPPKPKSKALNNTTKNTI